MNFDITPKNFYIIGIFSFSVIGISNLVIFLQNVKHSNFFSITASLAGLIFNFALVGLFIYLLKQEPSYTDTVASDDIEEVIKEIKKK